MDNDANLFFNNNKKIMKYYNDFLSNELEGCVLSPNEIAVIAQIEECKSASAIAKCLNVSKALVSRSVKNLKKSGYIVTSISLDDKREQSIELTDEGKALYVKIGRANEMFYNKAFHSFDDNEKAVLSALINLILKNLQIPNNKDI